MSASETQSGSPLTCEQLCKAVLTLLLEDREKLMAELCRSIEEEQKEIEQSWLEESNGALPVLNMAKRS